VRPGERERAGGGEAARRRLRRLVWAVLAGAAALLVAALWRGYRPELAVVTGVAVGAFVFAVLGTVERMRPLG